MDNNELNKIFVLSDVHGNIELFNQLLEYWDDEKEQLLILGDLGDRGPESKACFQKAKELKDEKGAIVLRGNHEEMLYDFLQNPEEKAGLYFMNGGLNTVASFLNRENIKDLLNENPRELADAIIENTPWLVSFIEELGVKYEWEDYVFVHAGVNLTLDDWRESSDFEKIWIREGFLDQTNHFEKIFIFGHTPTMTLNSAENDFSIWDSGDGKIGIDGGAVFGGVLHGLVINSKEIEQTFSAR